MSRSLATLKWPGFGVQKPEEKLIAPSASSGAPGRASVDLTPLCVVHTPPADPAVPVSPIVRIGCMSEIPLPDQSLLRKPIEKHEHARLDEHEPGESVDHRGTIRKDN